MNRLFLTVLMMMILLAATERQAFAYTDPGTGSLIVQALFAALASFLFQFRRIRIWLKSRGGPKA